MRVSIDSFRELIDELGYEEYHRDWAIDKSIYAGRVYIGEVRIDAEGCVKVAVIDTSLEALDSVGRTIDELQKYFI